MYLIKNCLCGADSRVFSQRWLLNGWFALPKQFLSRGHTTGEGQVGAEMLKGCFCAATYGEVVVLSTVCVL